MNSVNRACLGELAAVSNHDRLGGGTRLRPDSLHGIENTKTFFLDLAEDDVLSVEPIGINGAQEELRSVGVRAGVSHGQAALPRVLATRAGEGFVSELVAIDRLTAGAVAAGEVSALAHELLDDSVEGGALVVQRLAGPSGSLLAGAQGTEVFGGLRARVVEQFHFDAARTGPTDGDVKKDGNIAVRVGHGARCV